MMQVLRLRLPAEVRVSDSKCQRAKVNGALLVIMPKVNPHENAVTIRGDQRARAAEAAGGSAGPAAIPTIPMGGGTAAKGKAVAGKDTAAASGRTVLKPKKLSVHEQMLQDAQAAAAAAGTETGARNGSLLDAELGTAKTSVNVANIVRRREPVSDAGEEAVKVESVFRGSSKVEELD